MAWTSSDHFFLMHGASVDIGFYWGGNHENKGVQVARPMPPDRSGDGRVASGVAVVDLYPSFTLLASDERIVQLPGAGMGVTYVVRITCIESSFGAKGFSGADFFLSGGTIVWD